MKIKIAVLLLCSECGGGMYATYDYIECTNADCLEYKVKYEYPTIEVEKYNETKV